MAFRPRIYYNAEQKSQMWDRWQKGESLNAIGRVFDRPSSSIFNQLSPSGGIRPPPRRRAKVSLTLSEREEISRSIVCDLSVRAIASQLGRSPSTVSREINRNGGLKRYRASQADQAAPAAESSVGSVTGELGEIGQFLLGAIERMGLGPFEISESKDGEMVVLQVKGPAGQMLSSGQGRTVDALQLLVNQVAARVGPDRQRVVIDVEGDADAREEFLGKLAERVAKRALQTGRAVALDPMNGRDRRLIHVALRDREDVATMSEGEGRYRQVVVVPENSDEFDEARAKSERAANNN